MTFTELFQTIEERRELVQAATERANLLVEDLDKLELEIVDISLIGHRYELYELNRAKLHYFQVHESILQFEDETWREAVKHETALHHQFRECLHELEHLWHHVADTHVKINIKQFDVMDYAHDLEELIDECTFKLSMAFGEVFDQCGEIKHQIDMAAHDAKVQMDGFHDAIAHDLTRDVEETALKITKSVDQISSKQLPAAANRFKDTIHHEFDRMTAVQRDEAARLCDYFEEAITYMMNYVDSYAIDGNKEMFDKFINGALVKMEASAKQLEGTFEKGAIITGAITPWLPALRKVTEMVEYVQTMADAS